MEPKEYELMYNIEDSHWWYQGMASMVRNVVRKFCLEGKTLRILDAGCGTGANMRILADYGDVIGLDLSPHAIHLSRRRGQKNVMRASVMALPFASESFDMVTSFDILYFAGMDDELAFREARRVLVLGGKMILRVPAFDWLRGIHDEKVSTGHRYTLNEIANKMEHHGLQVVFINYVNTILFPLIVLKRLGEKLLPRQTDSDIAIDLGPLGALFRACLILESRVMTRISIPFGVSILAVGKKSLR
jgi:ubiquinone/menaquinone biosynthesis C-methylase UbiE